MVITIRRVTNDNNSNTVTNGNNGNKGDVTQRPLRATRFNNFFIRKLITNGM